MPRTEYSIGQVPKRVLEAYLSKAHGSEARTDIIDVVFNTERQVFEADLAGFTPDAEDTLAEMPDAETIREFVCPRKETVAANGCTYTRPVLTVIHNLETRRLERV